MNSSPRESNFVRRCATVLALLVLIGFAAFPQSCSAAGQSVEEFLKTKPRWPKLIGTTFRIEGRVTTGAGTVLKLHKLPLLFISEEELPELSGSDLAVEVVGRLRKRETGVFEFELITLRRTESDIQRVIRQRADLPRDDPEPWYELGNWAMNRVSFYQSGREIDRALVIEGRSIYRMALRKERTIMTNPTYQSLKALAVKSEKYGLGDEFKLPLLYEAHYQTWHDTSAKVSSEELEAIALRIARELPDAATPVDEFDADFVSEWRKGPVRSYKDSDESLRPQLHRLLYQQVMLESIGKAAEIDGRNGDEIAASIAERIPEFTKLAEAYRQKALDWKIEHVKDLLREDAVSLRQHLIDTGDEARADAAIRAWFTPVESRLRRQGAVGLIELAFEYEDLFDDGDTAVQLLLESDRVKPGSSYVAERLEGYGYIRVEGRWRRQGDASASSQSPIDIAIKNGRVIRGMTSAHVRRAMGRQPDSISRVLTSREVLEYWVYRTQSGSGLSVRLSRPLNRHEGIVRRVFDLPTR
ncbi:MAG: hypothetical protein ACI8P0_005852 [Planctomycetaceae bacterium]|jgi:hypothetical protein